MRDPFIINSPEGVTLSTDSPRRFRKELIGEGVFQHPTRPWAEPLTVDEAYLNELAANTNAALAHGIKTPVPNKHTDGEDPEANRGFLDAEAGVEVGRREDGNLALYGVVEVTNPDTAEQIGKDLRDVSVYIDSFGSGDHTPAGDRIVHVALTNYPVYSGQENFVALSTVGGVSSIPVLREVTLGDERNQNMKITDEIREGAKALGIDLVGEDMTPEDLSKVLSAAKPADPVEPATEADVPRLLSVNADDNKYFSAYREQAEARIADEVEAAEKAGKLTTDAAEACKTLLSVGHGFALSAKGAAESVDVPALVRVILSSIPEKAVVNVDDRPGADKALEAGIAAAPENDPADFTAEDAQAHADRILGN